MKKLIMSLLFTFITSSFCYSQDVIVKQNGDEIEAVVIEVSSDNIKYKDFDYQDGPLRNISVHEVFMIKYKNGTKELLNKAETTNTQTGNDANLINQYEKDDEFKTFMIGMKGGVNFSTLSGEHYQYDIKGRTSFHLGMVMNFGLSEMFSIQPELLYSEQGFTLEYYNYDGNDNYVLMEEVVKLNYINLPIMASFEVVEGLNIQTGPQFGFNVEDFPDDFDFGIGIGAQYTLPINLFFQARYMIGLSDVTYNGKNRVLSVSMGYLFN